MCAIAVEEHGRCGRVPVLHLVIGVRVVVMLVRIAGQLLGGFLSSHPFFAANRRLLPVFRILTAQLFLLFSFLAIVPVYANLRFDC